MVFTVTLSAPAPAGGASVNFTTQDEAPALNHATAGQDYTTTSGTINFAQGEQIKTIAVPILSDSKMSEVNETFLVVLSSPVNATIMDGTATGTILITNQPGSNPDQRIANEWTRRVPATTLLRFITTLTRRTPSMTAPDHDAVTAMACSRWARIAVQTRFSSVSFRMARLSRHADITCSSDRPTASLTMVELERRPAIRR